MLPCPVVKDSSWRKVIMPALPVNSDSRRPTGSSRASFPSSTTVMMRAAATHLDAEAIGNCASGSISPTSTR